LDIDAYNNRSITQAARQRLNKPKTLHHSPISKGAPMSCRGPLGRLAKNSAKGLIVGRFLTKYQLNGQE